MRRIVELIYLLILLAPLSCMGPEINLKSIPEADRTLFIHNFTNASFDPDVNIELADEMRRETERRGNFIQTKERQQAKYWLFGEITVYRKEGRMFDNYRTPIRFELIVAARVRLQKNSASGESDLLLSDEIAASGDYSDKEGYIETEQSARSRVLRMLATRINRAMDESFAARNPIPEADRKE